MPDVWRLGFAKEPIGYTCNIELLASFVGYCSSRHAAVALATFGHFCDSFCQDADIHLVIQRHGLDEEQARRVLRGYYSVWNLTEPHGSHCIPHYTPALLSDPDVSLMALFGGQGGMENYMDEARWLLDVYAPLLGDFVSRMSAFLDRECQDPRLAQLYDSGLDPPPDTYFAHVSVAIPITGLVQLMHVMVLYKTLGISPGELTDSFTGAMAELERPESHISHDLVQEAENHEGTPAPMVSVRGIDKPQLLQLIHEYNGRQSGKWASVYLSLVNTRNQFVVSGMTAPLAKFVRQSRVPFSQRKPNAKMSYLTINGPYHCELLQPVIDKQREYAYEKGWVLDAAGPTAELFKEDIADVIEAHNWQKQFAPRLVRTAHNDQLHIDTPMHRILGMPPLMVGGMTPTTVNEKFVGAISQAGYHVELAGGGIFTREALEAKVNSLMQYIRPGQGITLNGIYLNQRLWAFHYSEILRLRRAGFPIAGVCIGAGVPSLEVANEIIQSFRVAGLQHVIQIAHDNSDFPVILQWTGGRAGGHHSCEDFHQPLLETYAAIRGQQNIVLVVGSGFGDADGTIPYLTGDWSLTYGRAPMPADGILVASRVMTALEAGTSLAGKQLLAQTPGLVDSEWEKTYVAAAGGIITTPSEYGELMHAVATRSAIFCREMHDTILPKRDYIIARLNADHDLEEMTYLEVSLRLAELMYIQRPARWIDPSYLVLFGDFIRHIEDRFSGNVHAYELQTIGEISDPLLTSSDATYFIALCRRRGQKPVPFIPVLDKDFASWLLKDTIGQSEDIDSVFDQDIQRTTILQGPVAARYVTKVNEPVKDILDGIYRGQIAALLHPPAPLLLPDSVQRHMLEDSWVYQLPDDGSQLPDLEAWVEHANWPTQVVAARTADSTSDYARAPKFTDNFVRSIMRPRPGQVVSVHLVDGVPMRIRVSRRNPELPVEFMFIYRPDTPYALIREVMDERDSRICLPMRAIASIGDGCGEPFESAVDMTNPTSVPSPDTFRSLKVGDTVDYEVSMQELVNVVGGKKLDADLVPGSVLEFELYSQYRYKTDTVYSYIKTTGRVMRRDGYAPGHKTVVGEVDFECLESLGNPVVVFLQRHGAAIDSESLFDGLGIPVQRSMQTVAPRSAHPYAEASGDINPIHTNPYMANYAGLPGTIIHGMWTAAATRAFVEDAAAHGIPDRMRAYSAEFVDMVFPGDRLETKLHHIGMKNGRMLFSGETTNQHGSTVLTCTAEIEQPLTAMVFTGQGSSQACGIRADAHMLAKYGVSLLSIVRGNPTEGTSVRSSYMSLTTEVPNGDGTVRIVPLFPGINTRTRSFKHRAVAGLLKCDSSSRKPAQTVFALACIADMRAKSLISERTLFAGHSLGEFGALAAMTHIFTVEDIVDITFYRGMLLNMSVERDEQNCSQYGMVAVNPTRVTPGFGERELCFLVNFNVDEQQYVVTGHLSQLEALRRVLDIISSKKIDTSGHAGKEHTVRLIQDVLELLDGDITPRRGRATIPLSGIDPVACFRRCLQERIPAGRVDYQQLRDVYIPNVTARAFEVSRSYFQYAESITHSPILAQENDQDTSNLARTLLIELIAYQFASPVRWIATQKLLFGTLSVDRLIEVGPTPTLNGMAHKTLATDPFAERDVAILHILQNESDVYYSHWIDVTDSKTIKELAGGKSTLQNEIVSELQKEFGKKVPDKAEEMPLGDLAASIGAFGGALGKTPTTLIARMFAAKMPGGFTQSSARAYLKSAYGFGAQRQTALFLVAVTMEPPSRITQEVEAKRWLHAVAEIYAKRANISLADASGSSGSGSAGGDGVPVVNSAEFELAQKEQREHSLRQIKVLAQHIGLDLCKHERMYEAAMADNTVTAGSGDEFVGGIQPMFDKNKARFYDSCWNWVRIDMYELQMLMLANRSTPQLVKYLHATVGILEQQADDMALAALQSVTDVLAAAKPAQSKPPVYKGVATITRPHTTVSMAGEVLYEELAREDEPSYSEYVEHMCKPNADHESFLFIKSKARGRTWLLNKAHTDIYFDGLRQMCTEGLSLGGTTALVTGCGCGSIGSEVLKGLLASGAKVLATTSSYCRKSTQYFEDIYRKHGSRGSQLVVVPFNQGSISDIQELVDFVYSEQGLNWDLDFIVPFASVSEIGQDITGVRSKSELAHRVMLTNTIRLLGQVASVKARLGLDLSPTQAILPLSPNHGVFGGDGLYGESKAGLETLLNRWRSESWSAYLSIVGADIGWTRGTRMMDLNDTLAEVVEQHNVRTFSPSEMAFNILGLLHPAICDIALESPVWADLSGGFEQFSENISSMVGTRHAYAEQGKLRVALLSAAAQDHQEMSATRMVDVFTLDNVEPLSYEQLAHLRHLEGMVNLDKVVVVTGYGEVNPFGNAETRWQMEAYGEFSLEGCAELAWIMGLIKHHSGPLASTGDVYIGWVDSESNEPVKDHDIKARYESRIVASTGIRVLDPSATKGYDPNNIVMMREIQVDHDLEPFEATADEAGHFKRGNGDRVDVWENPDGTWSVRFLKGAVISVPKALQFDRLVTAQLPTGWSAERYGIPKDIIDVVDPVVLYGLVATVEALLRSGITDPYELYKYFHVSEVGNSTGACFGGADAMKDIFGNGALDKDVKTDVVQEMFINTVAAWTNMLLFVIVRPHQSYSRRLRNHGHPRMMVAGAFDSYSGDAAYALGKVNATASSIDEGKRGRTPAEMSRPCTSSRNGFVESLGAGILTLMSASAAIEFGAPIYGVLAMTATSTDKEGRSVPAPGQGILTTAREISTAVPSPLLDFEYRREELAERIQEIDQWVGPFIQCEATKLRKDAQDKWCNEFWHRDPTIAPLRGSLATWGLTVDDIGLGPHVINQQFGHLGRTPGHAVPAVCQKWLTGHPKGPAAAWMLSGALQSLRTGIVPGNRNADNIDEELEQYDYIFTLEEYHYKVMEREAKACCYWSNALTGKHTFVQVKDAPPYTDKQEPGVYLNPMARVQFDPVVKKYRF
ncbi:hypothetical protein DL89DRAFT_320387 [Linderina pennispora]|uniref:Carrier domain-containing protein n=1 Tax=Linderina pennispora TaxID=61395 RepID=A0A1Y1WN62_9FUNG|nr:uncharacterized protein DL89DRAFT_320387 [Linderina pennispora]ORX74997.1 hypothetical protein DL89DRAFT_320387 [Linderina pennispora]